MAHAGKRRVVVLDGISWGKLLFKEFVDSITLSNY